MNYEFMRIFYAFFPHSDRAYKINGTSCIKQTLKPTSTMSDQHFQRSMIVVRTQAKKRQQSDSHYSYHIHNDN